MKVLQIFKSPPDDITDQLSKAIEEVNLSKSIHLHQGDVDWHQLVKEVFKADKTICWW